MKERTKEKRGLFDSCVRRHVNYDFFFFFFFLWFPPSPPIGPGTHTTNVHISHTEFLHGEEEEEKIIIKLFVIAFNKCARMSWIADAFTFKITAYNLTVYRWERPISSLNSHWFFIYCRRRRKYTKVLTGVAVVFHPDDGIAIEYRK